MRWEYLREEEFKSAIEKSGGLCVMCLGCMEKHGQHLPVGTDSLHGDKIVELAAERAGVAQGTVLCAKMMCQECIFIYPHIVPSPVLLDFY